jgi:hypothetical protein
MPIELEAVFASSRAPKGKHFLFVEDGMSMNKLRDAVHGLFKVHPHQQGLSIVKRVEGEEQPVTVARLDGASRTLGSFAAEGGFGLADAGLQLIDKDYGRQIGYKTVFIVEYLGPILIMMFYAMRPSFLMGAGASARPWHWVAKWGVVAWLLHFIKRELETLYVHKFSRPTMPFFNLFKNSIYYWGFALVVGRCLCDPDYTAPEDVRQVRAACAGAGGWRGEGCGIVTGDRAALSLGACVRRGRSAAVLRPFMGGTARCWWRW